MDNLQNHTAAKFLKRNAIEKILINMIEDIKNGDPTKGRPDVPFLLIILDDFTSKIISSYVGMSDVLNKGIFSVEKLEIGRQKFPNYQALYFISPTKTSIDYLLKDFEDKANPHYKRIHLFFSSTIMDSNLGLLATEKLYPRISTCKELNLSFFCRNKNLFDFGLNDYLDIFATKNDKDKEKDKLAILSERLFSACSVLNEYPYIQYQKNSALCHELAFSLNAKLRGLYSDRSDYTRGLMLITDRTLDICTPLLHDYTYESLLFDLLKPEEFTLKSNDENRLNRKIELDEKDEIWNRYRTAHIAEVFEKISKEASEFYNMMKGRDGKNNEKGNKEFDEMKKALREAKSMKSKSEAFNFHIESCQTLGTRLKEHDISNLIDYEQDIITGSTANGDNVSNKDIFLKFTTLNLNKKELEIKARIALIIIINLDLTENEFNKLSENNNYIKKLVDNLSVRISQAKVKNPRRVAAMTKQELKKIKDKLANENDLVNLRSEPKLVSTIESWGNIELSNNDFSFVDEPKNMGIYRKKISTGVFFNSASQDEEKPNFIYFNIGGLSHNEISSMEKLVVDKRFTQNMIIGTDKIITADEYLNSIKNLSNSSNLDVSEVDLKYK